MTVALAKPQNLHPPWGFLSLNILGGESAAVHKINLTIANRPYNNTLARLPCPTLATHPGTISAIIGNAESLGKTVVSDGEWHYLVVTWANEGTIDIYIDGTEEEYWSQNTATDPTASADNLRIGQYYTTRSFSGNIEEMRISSVVRGAAEIATIWNSGDGLELEVDGDTEALWHFNEGADATAADETTVNNGTITDASWDTGITFPSGGWANIAKINGIAVASIAKINGVAV